MVRDIDRRDFLKGVGATGTLTVAGCLGDGDEGGDLDGEDDDVGGEDGDADTPEDGGADRDEPIEYGVLLPQTGDLASVGQLMTDAARLPAAQLSEEDLGGLSVEETVEDSQTDPSAGISAAESLINAGVPAVCGPASSGVNIQVSREVFIPNEVVGCSPSSTAPSVTDLDDDDYIFRTAPSDALQGQVMAQVATEELDASTAVTMFVNNDYGQLLSKSFVSAFEERDGEVTAEVSFEKQQPDYTSKLQEALSDDPDTLIIIGYPESGIQIFTDYYSNFEGDTDILVTDGLQDPDMQQQVGNPMENVVGTAPQPSGPAADAFADLYEEEYGQEPGIFNSHSYDAAAVLVLANAYAGENDSTAIRDAMREVANPDGEEVTAENLAEGIQTAAEGEAINYEGASSPVDFDDNGDMETVTYSVWEFAPDSEEGIEVVDSIEYEAEEE